MCSRAKNHGYTGKIMKTLVLWILLIVSQFLCAAQDNPQEDSRRTWYRSRIAEVRPDGKDTRLQWASISQESEHLICSFLLVRQREGAELVVQGHLNKFGEFAANVSLDVSDQEDGNWKQIESSFSEKIDVKLVAAPHVGHLLTQIQMDAFQPYIGKVRFGRVNLQSGESEVFPMVWLTEKGD
jgi:hypothetical protein